MSASLVFPHLPNAVTQVIDGADTNWHQITPPAHVVPNPSVGIVVTMVGTNQAKTGPSATNILVDFNTPSAPTVGFPILSGATLVFSGKNTYWYKFTTATDSLYLIWQY